MDWAKGLIYLGSICGAIAAIKKLIIPYFERAVKDIMSSSFNQLHQEQLQHNKEISQTLDKLDKKIDKVEDTTKNQILMFQSLQKQINENELDRIRQEMVNFSHQCHNKGTYTQSEFDYIFKLHSKYERLIEETGLPNGVIDAEYSYILNCYLALDKEKESD